MAESILMMVVRHTDGFGGIIKGLRRGIISGADSVKKRQFFGEKRERTQRCFFMPGEWTKLSHEYLVKAFGPHWQREYIIWDCAAGTGNLLEGLWNRNNVYMSTLDEADVQICKEIYPQWDKDHIFQFDFLNDDKDAYGKLISLADSPKIPASLRQHIKNNPEKIIFLINSS